MALQRYTEEILVTLKSEGIFKEGKRLYWSVVVVEPGAKAQGNHRDKVGDTDYWTVFIPMTKWPNQGTTLFPGGTEGSVDKPYYFHGDVEHRGGANRSNKTRIVLCCVVCNEPDRNRRMHYPFVG